MTDVTDGPAGSARAAAPPWHALKPVVAQSVSLRSRPLCLFVCLFDTHASRSRPAATAQSDSQDCLSAWLASVEDAQRLLSAASDLRGVVCKATRACNSEAFALRTSVCLRLSVNSDELASCRWPATLTRGIRHTDAGCTRYRRGIDAGCTHAVCVEARCGRRPQAGKLYLIARLGLWLCSNVDLP